jgi:uncharacterized protein
VTTSVDSDRQVRDLIWAINSPSLLAQAANVAATKPWRITHEQVDQQHLSAYLTANPARRVGRYFEQLVLYWLKYLRRVEVIAESVQVRAENRTVGEIDLVFRDELGRLTHWEIAVKFYLHFPFDTAIGSHYIGPNAADTFERKITRLFAHQLPLSATRFPNIEVREAFVKGRIFYHPALPMPTQSPSRLSADHLRCVWIRATELEQLAAGSAYRVLRKPHWLSAEEGTDDQAATTLTQELTEHFASHHQPVLVSQFTACGEHESACAFVVPENWPGTSPLLTSTFNQPQ